MTEQPEVWKQVPGFCEFEVSSLGRVRRCVTIPYAPAGRMVARQLNSAGTVLRVRLRHNGKARMVSVARLVLLTFRPVDRPVNFTAKNIDNDPMDCALGNLEWVAVNRTRRRNKSTTNRPCMCCKKSFRSTGVGNRLCGTCRHKDDYMAEHLPSGELDIDETEQEAAA